MNKKRLIAPAIVIVLLVAATLYFEVFRKMDSDSSRIEGSGTIEVTEIDISSKISGRLAVLPRAEGESVKKGDLVVKLEYDELSAQKLSALANYVNAEKNYQRISELYKSGQYNEVIIQALEARDKIADILLLIDQMLRPGMISIGMRTTR